MQAYDISIVKDKMNTVTPMIHISRVTGDGLDSFERTFEFLVEDIYNLKKIGVVVVSGFANAGRAIVGQKVCIGPVMGSFIRTHVKSAQMARTNVSSVVAGTDACLHNLFLLFIAIII